MIRIVAKILTPIIIFTTSLKPVNLTTPLCELTNMKLIIPANTTNGICFRNMEKSKSI